MKAYHLATISISVASGQRTYINGTLTFASANIATLVDASVSCGASKTYSTTLTISDLRRHDVAYTNLPSVPVATGGLCVPKFSIYLKTQVTSGGAAVTHGRATAGEMGVLFVLPT